MKLNKTLIKKGFRSIFKTKLFSILMFVIVLISGAAYTMLESSSRSLADSYNNIMANGNLADSVIKVNFVTNPDSKLEIGLTDQVETIYDDPIPISKENIENEKYSHIELDKVTGKKIYTLKLMAYSDKDFQDYNNKILTISFEVGDETSFDDKVDYVKTQADDFKSEIMRLATLNLSQTFTNKLNEEFAGQLIAKDTKTLSVSFGVNAFKMVNLGDTQAQELAVNEMVIYDGSKLFTTETSDEILLQAVKDRIAINELDEDDFNFNTLKGYKVTAVDQSGQSITVVDPSSYEAIVSPAYANAQGKTAISRQKLQAILKNDPNILEDLSGPKKENLIAQYGQNIVWIDQTPYFIIGIGITPDFVYPIIDNEHIAIDVNNQGIVFTNNRGYERIYDAFRSNPQENYIAVKYNDKLNSEQILSLKSNLRLRAKDGPNYGYPDNKWPNNIKVLTDIDDRNDQSLLVQERVVFLSDINQTIETLSYVTTTLLVIFLGAIIWMIFSVLININKKTFATMLALGYSRTKIALSNSLSSLLLVCLPSLIGYIAGYFMQFWFVGIFDNYWTIPTYANSFSILSFLLVGISPLVFVGGIIAIVTYYQLRHPIPELLKESTDMGISLFGNFVAKVQKIGIMTKYALGLSVKNIGKLILLLVTAIIALAALTVGLGSLGRASYAYNRTIAMTNYNFNVELFSPTYEGGQYSQLTTNELNGISTAITTYDDIGNPKVDLNKEHWHIPSQGDALYGLGDQAKLNENLEDSATYLKNKLQTKVFLDKEVAGLNAWDIAERLMPENQKNIANEDAEKTLAIQEPGKELSINEQIAKRINDNDLPYILSYNNVITNNEDELYTYIDAEFTDYNNDNYHIQGVNTNTKMVNLPTDLLNEFETSEIALPIAINKYIAELYDLDRGDKIKIQINNHAKRNFKNFEAPIIEAEILAVVDGYDSIGLYTSQNKANQILGLDDEAHFGSSQTGFNAVFTKEQNPALLRTLPLYSPSGLYIGSDSIYGDWEEAMEKMLADSDIWAYGLNLTRTTPLITDDIREFKQLYSTTPYVSATTLVNWREVNKLTFQNISELASTIIYIIELISITLSIVFTLIVATLLLISNRKKIATLWTLGYRKSEIVRVFLSIYILPLLFAIMIAIPISLGILEAMKIFVIGFGNILIPFALTWWVPIVAILIIAIIFVAATVITIYSQRESSALAAFKGD